MAVVAALSGLVALPIATWWVVGDQSYKLGAQERYADLDYAFKPLALSAATERAVGVAALVVVVASVVLLIVHARRGEWDHRWVRPLGAAAAAGVIVGCGWRVMTAGVIGANIGAGLAVLLGGPLVVALLVVAVAISTRVPSGGFARRIVNGAACRAGGGQGPWGTTLKARRCSLG